MIVTPISPALLRGFEDLERTPRGVLPHRLPGWVRAGLADPQLLFAEAQPAGVRVVGVTAARRLELVTHPTHTTYRGIARPRGSVDLVIDGRLVASDTLTGGDAVEIDLSTGASHRVPGPPHVSAFDGLPAGEKRVELWLPHNESVQLLDLRGDAPVAPAESPGPVWVHHGSSISQGSNATTPARTWPSIAARQAGVELRNLGFGGSALVDPFLARVIRDTAADFISLKLGINVVNSDAMRRRAFVPAVHGFLDTIRDGHPATPLLLVSPVFCGIHEDTPGPGMIEPDSLRTGRLRFAASGSPGDRALGRLTLTVIRDALAEIVESRHDPALHYLDGRTLYGAADADELPLPDALHPDTASHERIARRFAGYAFAGDGPFAGARPPARS
ncbi:lipase [Actinocatenispora thailandica]|uniref:Lipase n=1 Tax=Actinocatenispora thailandica TaxID=227318 RepID=A0A7R7DMG4_9ACTN|nr:SGNH/GDSL hydrolase family protein [Actinocatenispora thailandica]BCJ34082.1 lipase [Actinocatenispora thailandica]